VRVCAHWCADGDGTNFFEREGSNIQYKRGGLWLAAGLEGRRVCAHVCTRTPPCFI
jgi:hypothetical protein